MAAEQTAVPDERVIFGNTAEGLFHIALKGKLSDRAREDLKLAGFDYGRPVQIAYPRAIWRRLLEIAAADYSPEASQPEAIRRLGQQVVLGICETMLGKAMVTLGRLLGPAKALSRMQRNFRNADNYVESKLTVLGPTRYVLWVSDTLGWPTYYQGVLEAAMQLTGAKDARITVVSSEGDGATYRIEWG